MVRGYTDHGGVMKKEVVVCENTGHGEMKQLGGAKMLFGEVKMLLRIAKMLFREVKMLFVVAKMLFRVAKMLLVGEIKQLAMGNNNPGNEKMVNPNSNGG